MPKMMSIEISIILVYIYSIIGHIMTFNEICNDLAQMALQSGPCQYN